MKVVCHVFFILICFMVFYPCSDGLTCIDEKNKGIAVSTADHEHTSTEKDVCTPFCQCSCCHTEVNEATFYTFTSIDNVVRIEEPILLHSSLPSIVYSVWQPPKL